MKIMQKCGGLPLAVKSIGCLLRSKMDMQTWMEISESEFWEYSDDNEEVFSALRLSFYRLPAKLKPCFLMCTSYPKGQPFTKDDMIHLWIAQGYIHPKTCETPEKVAGEYFDELNERSLIEIDLDLSNDCQYLERRPLGEISSEQLFNTDQNFYESHVRSLVETFHERKTEGSSDQSLWSFQGFKLHDMVWDVAKSLSSHVLSVTADDEGSLNVSNKVQHLFLRLGRSRYRHDILKSLPRKVTGPLRYHEMTQDSLIHNDLMIELLRCMENLRIKSSQEYCLAKEHSHFLTVQNRVSQLRKMNYLRTLVLEYWDYAFPIDIHRFAYLRALVLDSCNDRGCISAIQNLKHLRYLHVTNCYPMICENLEHLTESGCHLYSLEKLIISTCCLEFSMKSCNLLSLRYLHLSGQFNDRSLHSFCHLYNLDTLCLQNCGNITGLPLFIGNLMNLRRLQLAQISKIRKFDHDSFRCQNNNNKCQLTKVIFPALEELEFDGLYDLQDWCGVQDSDCPKMQSITIRNCCKLRRIPYFGYVRKLTISKLTLTDLQLWVSNNEPSRLQTLDIRDCKNLTSLIGLKYLCSLGTLNIARCPELTVFGKEKLPYKPQHVFIDDCLLLKGWCDEQELYYQAPEMVKISDVKRANELGIAYFQSFKHLSLDVCPEKGPELILTPNNWLASDLRLLRFESSCGVSSFHRGLSTLRRLEIRGCPKLVALMGLEELNVLHSLVIEDCPLLYMLPEMKLPPRLSSLMVQGCHKLLSLHLNISEPSVLTELEVSDCQGLVHIEGLRYLSNLESLVLLHCPLLELQELLPGVPESVAVFLCPKLKKWCEIQSIEYQESVPDSSYETDA
ncbi:putative disease resistance protein RGA1 [Phragmites australis]|uniref:putative disease resistance protein RGA1 n=1 Tax=Phragmites australis TaxID=29695 RepID=UPI002D771A45|nr:putative disease resistance protein RGA1 [Phragmites australis]